MVLPAEHSDAGMPLTILSDENVKSLLASLTSGEVEALQISMRNALHEYSNGTQDQEGCSDHQPKRSVMEQKNGNTTLFMPSISKIGIGIKGQKPRWVPSNVS